MISIQNLSVEFNSTALFSGVNFVINKRDKIALVGKNGAGKSTMLKIIAGLQEPTGGVVAAQKDITIGYLPQQMILTDERSVVEEVRTVFGKLDEMKASLARMNTELAERTDYESESYAELIDRISNLSDLVQMEESENGEAELEKTLLGLGFVRSDFDRNTSEFSGGWRMRIELAKLLLMRPDVLLLDEPTNHLDMDAVDWLGNYLESYHGTVLIISHDRWFIDQCCDRVIEIHDCTCDFYNGNYSYYAVERERRREEQLKHHEHELAEKKRLEATARSMHEHGTEHLAKRAASIEKRIARMKVTDRPKTDKKMSVTFGDPNYETEEVLKVRDITKSYDGREILQDVSFNIRNRERVALLGANGAGKTTMLKILLGEEAPDSGTIRKGVGLKPAYLPQQVYFANPHRNLIDTLIYDKNVSMQVARNRLGAFQFTGETQMKTVDMLSGGEKSRLRLCELMYDPLNLLILDEPTNHLDLASREWIEEAVEAFDGTLLFVSHDRYFVERFATRVLYLENGRLIDFIGSYSAFLDWRAKGGGALPEAEAAPVPKKKKAAVPTLDDVPKPPEKPKRTGGTKNLQKQLSTLEREISQLETQSGDLEQQMVDAASDSSRLLELMTEKEQCDEKLAAKMDEWEAVAAELEAMQ